MPISEPPPRREHDVTSVHDLRLAPSILSADFARLADEVADVAGVADLLHVDVMDAHYVDNLTIGPTVVQWLREATDLAFDTHLMITDPRTYGPRFVAAGSDSITFHPETDPDPLGLITALHEAGAEVGIAVRPSERVEAVQHLLPEIDLLLCMTVEPGWAGQDFIATGVDNLATAADLRARHGYRYRLEVDGGVRPETVAACVAAGADTLVAGSAIFGRDDRRAAARAILDAARGALRAGAAPA